MAYNQKLRQFINYLLVEGKVKNIADFADKCGLNRSGVSDKVSGRRPCTTEFVHKVKSTFPELNASWLLDDSDDMLINATINVTGSNNQVAGHDFFSGLPAEAQNILAAYKEQLNQAQSQIESQAEQIKQLQQILLNLTTKQ